MRSDPGNFLGGEILLHRKLSQSVILEKLGKPLQKDIEEAANSIYQVSLSNMAQLLREVTINRGYDPKNFKLLSYGGAGAHKLISLQIVLTVFE